MPRCVFCDEKLEKEDVAICSSCKKDYYDMKERSCSVCGKPIYRCSCTNEYLDSHFVHKLIKVYRYRVNEELVQNTLIYKLKRDFRRDVVDFLSSELCDAISASVKIDENTVFTSVPRRKSAKNKYGYDHAKMLAKAVAKKLSSEYRELLISKTKKAQKKTDSNVARMKNAAFKLKNENLDLSEKTVILIDDIVTTGASMGASAFQIKMLAPKRIIGASIAISYKDSYKRFSKDDRFFKKSSDKVR